MAEAGYKVGLTIAPIIAAPGWEEAYRGLIADIASAFRSLPDLDITAELITHRFTATSKTVLSSWYPGSSLDMSAENRAEKRTKFGAVKQVYDAATMKRIRSFFETELAEQLPALRILYFT
jgi:spore photoproduct lyase